MKDAFSSGLDHGNIPPPPPPLPLGQGPNNPSSQYIGITSSDFNKFGIPSHHYADKMPDDIHLGMGGGQTMLLPPPPRGSNHRNMMGVDSGGGGGGSGREMLQGRNPLGSNPSDNFFGLSLRQLGGLSVSQVEGPGRDGRGSIGGRPSYKWGTGMEKFPSPGVNLEGFRLNSLDCSANPPTTGSSMLSAAGTVVTPSSYVVMAPGMLPTSSDNMTLDSSSFLSTNVGGTGTMGSIVPIGTERAQKSTVLPPTAFPGGWVSVCMCNIIIIIIF